MTMTDDLVKRLRADNDKSFVETLCGEAADRIEALTAALQPLVRIADAYDENELDDEARKSGSWGENQTPHEHIELYQGRGGRQLLTLKDCMVARAALNTGKEPSHD
jgi:hypothetical protein